MITRKCHFSLVLFLNSTGSMVTWIILSTNITDIIKPMMIGTPIARIRHLDTRMEVCVNPTEKTQSI